LIRLSEGGGVVKDACGGFFWAVVSDSTGEAVELFTSREEAEEIVRRRLLYALCWSR
jgi:hypothetical protein